MNCITHEKRPAVHECDSCGDPICQSCYDAFETPDGAHVCSECYKEAVRSEIAEVKSLKSMVKGEFICIIIGLVFGLFVGIDFIISSLKSPDAQNMMPLMIIAMLYCPFIFGSLITIIKKIKNGYDEKKDTSGGEYSSGANFATLVMLIFANLLIAPITTIVRFVQRIGDMKQLNRIAENDERYLTSIDEFIAQSLQASAVSASATGEVADTELSLDSILAACGGSEAAVCDNGEILRTVRTR